MARHYRLENPDKIKAKQNRWREKHKQKVRQYKRDYYQRNKTKLRRTS